MQGRMDGRIHQLLDKTVAFAALLTPAGMVKDVSQNALDVAGVTLDEVLGRPFWKGYWFSHDPLVMSQIHEAVRQAEAGETSRFDYSARIGDDSHLIVDFQLAPILDDAGTVVEILASGVDVTARENSRATAETALREATHRIKNIFATVRSVANMTARHSRPENALADFTARLDALAAVHQIFADIRGPMATSFDLIARRILLPFARENTDRIRIVADCGMVHRDQAKLMGLCLHEMATNSSKFGALASEDGRLEISLTEKPGEDAKFTWRETFSRTNRPSGQAGYGLTFIRATLGGLMGGKVEIVSDATGFLISSSGKAEDLFHR